MMNLMLHSLQPSHGAVNFILAQLYIGVNTVRPQAQHEALQAARRRPQTRAFTKEYALREGIEATISEASSCLWHVPLPFYWPCQNAPATPWDCRWDECGTCGGLARWG